MMVLSIVCHLSSNLQYTCADVFSLPGDNDLDLVQDDSSYIVHNQETLRPGGWKYLDFQVMFSFFHVTEVVNTDD